MGKWDDSGKIAVVGIGHAPCYRRWDERPETSLGSLAMIAAQNAVDDAGLKLSDIDGITAHPAPLGGTWSGTGRPYPTGFDGEDGLSIVSSGWMANQLGVNLSFSDDSSMHVGNALLIAIEAVAEGLSNYCLVVRPLDNFAGGYRTGGPMAAETAADLLQWELPYSWDRPGISAHSAWFQRYLYKYGQSHDKMAPLIVNNRRNGLLYEYGFYYQNRPEPLTTEEYLSGRWIAKPLNLYDCDLPVHTVACFLVTTAERARDLKQPPAYVLGHSRGALDKKSTAMLLEEVEEWAVRNSKILMESSGLHVNDLDVVNLYDGYAIFPIPTIEGLGYGGVKQGEALDFFAGQDFKLEGNRPFNPSGGNNGTGRGHGIAHITDSVQQVQGRAGKRQIKGANISMATVMAPYIGAALLFGRDPG